MRAGENKPTVLTGDGNAPLLPPSAASAPRESVSRDFQVATLPYKSRSLATPEGEILAALCFAMLMRPKAERRADFPLRGKWCAAPIGVHFHRAQPGLPVFYARRAVIWFSISRSKIIYSSPAKPPPQPSARRAVKLKNPPAKGRSNLRTLTPERACP